MERLDYSGSDLESPQRTEYSDESIQHQPENYY